MVTGLKSDMAVELFSGRLAGETPSKVADIFKALGDETRLAIVQMLAGKELCVCDILDAFNMSQPTISHHLKILRQAGIVQDRREGKWIFYSLDSATLNLTGRILQKLQNSCSPNRL